MSRCHRLCFHRLSSVAEDGSTFVCCSQLCKMNAHVRRGRFVGGGEDGGVDDGEDGVDGDDGDDGDDMDADGV